MEFKKRKKQFWGMVLYDKVGDGCLNGLWNNNDRTNRNGIFNEIARKRSGPTDQIIGEYTCSWIERNHEIIVGTLIISRTRNNVELNFEWRDENDDIIFHGAGMEIGLRNIVATYWNEETLILR